MVASIGTTPAADPPDAKPLKLDHKTLDLYGGPDDAWRRFELTATITGERGEGRLRITHFHANGEKGEPLMRELFGDRMERLKPTGTTEHKITLKLVKSKDDIPEARRAVEIVEEYKDKNPFADPSLKGDRKIYNVEGPDFGTSRGLILMVSPSGVHRLIYFGRYGGPYAATLEPPIPSTVR
jgi:hypothetical protein